MEPSRPSTLNVVFWNVNGFKNLETFIEETRHCNFHILLLTETWLTDDLTNPPDFLAQYNLIFSSAVREKSMGRPSGGLMVVHDKRIGIVLLEKTAWWIIVKLDSPNEERIIFVNVYFRPGDDLNHLLEIFQISLCGLAELYSNFTVIVGGDFNSRVGNGGNLADGVLEGTSLYAVRESADSVRNKRGNQLLEFMDDAAFYLLNGRTVADCPAKFTFCASVGKSVVDLVWVNTNGLRIVEDLEVMQSLFLSDHFPVCLTLCNINTKHMQVEKNPECNDNREFFFGWDATLALTFQDTMKWTREVQGLGSVEDMYGNITNTIVEVASSLGLKKEKNTRFLKIKNPWFDKDCKSLKLELRSALRNCKKQNFEANF